MLIPLSDLHLIYKKIQSNINMQYTSVLIFVALDVDSVCALRIITVLIILRSVSCAHRASCLTSSQYLPTLSSKPK